MIVPSMSTEEIRIAIFEASVEYVKGTLDLQTLITIANKLQYFMGMREEDSTQIINILSEITELQSTFVDKKKIKMFIDAMHLESVDKLSIASVPAV